MFRTAILAVVLLTPVQERTSEGGLKFRVNPPKPAKQKSPVMVILHGTGGRIRNWGSWEDEARKRGYIVVVPESSGFGSSTEGKWRWGDVDIPNVVALAKEIQRTHNGDPKRTYIGGFSNGGFYSMKIGFEHPEVFSGVLCLGGGINVRRFSEETKRMGAYIVHGTKDPQVDFKIAEQARDTLKKNEIAVEFVKKDGGGHETFKEEAGPFYDWVEKFNKPWAPGSPDWASDYDAALQKAADEGKLVWAWFHTAKDKRSPVAEWFELILLVDPKMQELSKEFVLVKVDRETEHAKKLRIRRAGLAVISAEGKVLKKYEKPAPRDAILHSIRKVMRRK